MPFVAPLMYHLVQAPASGPLHANLQRLNALTLNICCGKETMNVRGTVIEIRCQLVYSCAFVLLEPSICLIC